MIHFFCSTPLQIYTAIVLSETEFKEEQKTIYIIDYFDGCDVYVSRLEKLKIFSDVILLRIHVIYERIKTRKNGILGFIFWNLYYYGRYSQVLHKLRINIDRNDAVFFSYLEPICLMLTKQNKKNKMCFHFYGFEDGIGAYTIPLDRPPGKIERYLGVQPFYKKECYWVYRPEYILRESKNCNVKGINFNLTKDIKEVLQKIWAETKDITIDSEVIFFDDLIDDVELDDFSKVLMPFRNKMVIKKHPRRKNDLYYETKGFQVLLPQSIPFESFLIENDINGRVLINTFSSAVVNSVFMFNQRPKIVFLYELLKDKDYIRRINEIRVIVNRIIEIYGNSDKIFIPNSLSECSRIISEII